MYITFTFIWILTFNGLTSGHKFFYIQIELYFVIPLNLIYTWICGLFLDGSLYYDKRRTETNRLIISMMLVLFSFYIYIFLFYYRFYFLFFLFVILNRGWFAITDVFSLIGFTGFAVYDSEKINYITIWWTSKGFFFRIGNIHLCFEDLYFNDHVQATIKLYELMVYLYYFGRIAEIIKFAVQ